MSPRDRPPVRIPSPRQPSGQDARVSGVPSPGFVIFRFFKFFLCSCVLSLAASESAGHEPSCPPFAGVYAAVHGSSCRHSRLSHPAVRGSSCRRSRLTQPAVRRRWRRRPRLTLAHRPAAESMPAGLPLTLCPPACLWLNARRPAADSSTPNRRWLKLARLLLTHAR